MDLYMQVGVVFLVMAAFSLFTYFYSAPAQQFSQGINQTSKKINGQLETISNLDIAPFRNNTNASGTAIYPLLRDAKANGVAVLIQTKNQQGLVVDYGVQLRSANDPFVAMSPYGYSGVGGNGGTDFERNFVTTVQDVFNSQASPMTYSSNMSAPTPIAISFGAGAEFPSAVNVSTLVPTGSAAPGGTRSGQFWMAPHLMLADPNVPDASKAGALGRTFSSTGVLYTDQVLKTDSPVNDNTSYADAMGSLYSFNQNASYYTTVVVDANNKVVGIYAEEHGCDPRAAVLGSAMLANGTITQLY